MTKKLLSMALVAGATALVACGDKDADSGGGSGGSDLCTRYLEAATECYSNLGYDLADYDIPANYCDAYVGVSSYNAYFECYIGKIAEADCTTDDGLNALAAAATECLPGQ